MNIFQKKQYEELKKKKNLGVTETKKTSSPEGQSTKSPNKLLDDLTRKGSSRQDSSKKETSEKWYKGNEPTEVETLAQIYKTAQTDEETARYQYGLYEQAKAEGHWSETYDKATSQYLTALGLTADQVNDELFIQAAPYMDAGFTTYAGNQSTSKKNSLAENFVGLYNDYQKTKDLQAEEAEALKEAQYWIAKGLTDEEIIRKLDIGGENSKYKQLSAALRKTKTGEYEPTTAPIQLLTSYGVQGMLYALRNPDDSSDDYKMNAVKAATGRGEQISVTPDEIARRTPGSGSWAPYSNGTTMDDEAIRFGVGKEFSPDWLDQNRDAVFASGDQKAIAAFGKVYAAETFTKKAEAEYAALVDTLNRMLSAGGDLDADTIINKLFYELGENKYPSLAKLDESLLSGKIIDTTRTIGYDRKSIEQKIRDHVAAQNALSQATTDPETMEQVVQAEKQVATVENGGTLLMPGAFIDAVGESVRKSILFDGAISPDTIRDGLAWVGNQMSEYSRDRRNRRKEKIEQEKQQKEEEIQKKLDMSEQLTDENDDSSAVSAPSVAIASAVENTGENETRSMTAEEYAVEQNEVLALEASGRYEEAAKKQFPLLVSAVTNSDDEYVKEIVTSVGSQEAALYLTRLIFEGDMLNQLDDDTVWDAVTNYEYYICKVLDIDPASADMFAQVMDFVDGGSYSQTKDNTGVGVLRTAESTMVQGLAKTNDLWATIAGAAMTGYGHAVKGTNWLINNTLGKLFGFQVNDTVAEATIEAGQNIDTYYEKISAREDAFMREYATPLEYYTASAGSETIKMGVQAVTGSAIAGAATNGAAGVSSIMTTKGGFHQLQTALDLAKVEGLTSHLAAATPFIADSVSSEYNAAYQETENPTTALLSAIVSGFATASLMNMDAIKNIESMGKFVPDLVDTLTAMPGAGMMAAAKRYGKAGMMYIGNMLKTAANEMIQEPTENFLTTWVTDSLKGKNFFKDRDWGEYASELASDSFYAAIGSFGNTLAAMPSWSRSAIYANQMMGKTGLTPAEVTGQLNSFVEDMNDPQVSAQVNANLEAIAVEARTGELISEGVLPEVDTKEVVAAKENVSVANRRRDEAKAALDQAISATGAAQSKFSTNPSADYDKNKLLEAFRQERLARREYNQAVENAKAAQEKLERIQAKSAQKSENAISAVRLQARADVEQAINAVAAEKEKEAEPAPSSYIDSYFDSSEHTQEEIEIANEYKASVDPTLLEAAKQYRLNGKLSASAIELGPVSAKERNSVQAQTGVDVTGYRHAVNSNFFAHVEKRHGLNGQENQSMSDLNDVARAEWVIKNADSVELVTRSDGTPETTRAFKDKNNKEDQLVRFKKRIDGNVYVVEAVGENNKKRLWLMTAYIQKNGTENNSQNQVSQPVPNGASTPEPYVQAEPSADGIIIPNADENVNANVDVSRTQVPPQTVQTGSQRGTPLKGQGVSQFAAQTGQNTPVLSDAVKKELRNSPYYQKTRQKGNVDKAITAIDAEGYEIRKNKLLDGTTNLYTPEGQAEAYVLARAAKEAGDASGESSIAFKIKESGTLLGQSLAMRQLYVEMTPEGKQQFIQRIVDQINQGYANRNKEIRVAAPDWLADRLKQAGDDKDAVEKVYDDSYAFIAEQMPPDWKTRFDAWRYTAMLANPRTHIRNILGNALFVPAVRVKNKIGALGEYALPKDQRTKSLGLIKKEYKDFAKTQIDSVKDALAGDGKHTPQNEIQQKRKNFNNSVLEWLSKGNGKLLEKEDSWFLNTHFTNALAGFLQARGTDLSNVDSATLHKGLDYAISEAQKATYRDASVVADKLSKFTRDLSNSESRGARAAGLLIEGTLPFKKTPINVMRRGIEYSPVGLANALSFGLHDLKTGKINANEFVDRIASGVTGTGLSLIGAMLYNLGHLKLSLDEPEDELDKLQGSQEYSVELGGYSYTIDWLSPSAMPLFVGGAIAELFSEGLGKVNLDTIGEALMNIAEPVFNLSMLDGVNSLLSAASYSENGVAGIAMRAAEGYATQFVPTVLGAFARTIDKVRRTTYTDKNSGVPSSIQYLFDSTVNKIPGASTTGQPYLDAWGDEDVTEQWWIRALENFISPGYINKLDTDGVEEKIAELFDLTGETGLLPKTPQKYFTVGGKRIDLTGEQYEQLTKERGQTAKKLHEELFANSEFLALPAEYQASALQDVWTYSTTLAKSHIDSGVTVAAWISSTSDPAETIMERAAEKQKSDQKDQFKNEMYSAIDGGDSENAATCVAGLIEMGTTAKSLKTSLTNKYKQVYKNMYADGDIAGMRELEDTLILLNIGYRESEFADWLD